MKKIVNVLIITLVCAVFSSYKVEEIPNVQVKDARCYVSNPDGILKSETVNKLNAIIDTVRQIGSAEIAVVVDESIDTDDYNKFATDLFTAWGIGDKEKDNGVLVLVVADIKKYVIRSGYGAEGVLPDIICGRIGRENLIPHFKDGDYDAGLIEGISRIRELLTTPGAIEELKSDPVQSYDEPIFTPEEKAMFKLIYFIIIAVCTIAFTIWAFVIAITNRKKSFYDKPKRMKKLIVPSTILALISVGMGVLPLLVMGIFLLFYKSRKMECQHCGSKMKKMSEKEDNNYLSASQNLEECLNSVDYDVWICGKCGAIDIYPKVKENSKFCECENCGTRAAYLIKNRIIDKPTTRNKGRGEKTYKCKNCGKTFTVAYTIAKEISTGGGVYVGGGYGGSSSGGGYGGGFGGGSTGGGGASGGW